ncbi:MAG: hypothetical protein ACI8UD_002943 [Planctomycetota bacterium]|jgi:hypothetical protein
MGIRTLPGATLLAAFAVLSPLLMAQNVERSGEHFAVSFAGGALPADLTGKLADQAVAAAEKSWPAVSKLLGMRKATPPTLHIYTDVAAYRKLEQTFAPKKLPQPFFVQLEEQEAHLLLWPALSQQALEVVGLPGTTRQMLLRAAAQLMAAQYSSAAAADPWLAEVFAYAVLESIVNPKHEFGRDPAYDSRRLRLCFDLEQGKERELRGTYMDFSLPSSQKEADKQEELKCIMSQIMAGTKKGWARKLLPKASKRASKRRKAAPAVVTRSKAVAAVLGKSWSKIESSFSTMCMKVQPLWRAGGATFSRHELGMLAVGTKETAASCTAREPPDAVPYAIRAKCKLHPCEVDSFRVQLDWDQSSMIGCFFGVGEVSVRRWQTGASEWQELAKGKAPINAGQSFEAAVEVTDTVRLLVNGHEYAKWDRGTRAMSGMWSINVNDCVLWIEQLRIESLPK